MNFLSNLELIVVLFVHQTGIQNGIKDNDEKLDS
jgi:hypothetical protein